MPVELEGKVYKLSPEELLQQPVEAVEGEKSDAEDRLRQFSLSPDSIGRQLHFKEGSDCGYSAARNGNT